MSADAIVKYFEKEQTKSMSQMETLAIDVALLIQQNQAIQKTLEKIDKKIELIEERMEHRLRALEEKNIKEDGKNEIKNIIIQSSIKYWWILALSAIAIAANEPHILTFVKSLF